MNVRVLGCSGAIARGSRTTSFLIDDDVLIDAGTGVGDLTLEEMSRIDHVFLTHAHLDHIAAVPLMVDAVAGRRGEPLHIHALPGTLAALRAHIFNDVIWPDFTRIPSPQRPFVRLCEVSVGQQIPLLGQRRVEVLPAVHSVPAAGYAVSAGRGCWVFTGDTAPNAALWARLNQLDVAMLVIETAFGEHDRVLAERSRHLSPRLLLAELARRAPGTDYPVYITHLKPGRASLIMQEVLAFAEEGIGTTEPDAATSAHQIHWLREGQVFSL